MRRELKFRNNLDIAECGILNQLPNFILGVIAAKTVGLSSGPSTYGCKFRIFPYLNTPSRIINQMELQLVHLVHRHHIHIFLDKIHVIEISCDIQHHTSPGTFREITYGDTRHIPLDITSRGSGIDIHWKKLQKRLYSIEHTGHIGTGHRNSFTAHIKHITLFRQCPVKRQLYISLSERNGIQVQSGRSKYNIRQIAGIAFQTFLKSYRSLFRNTVYAIPLLNALGLRYYINGPCRSLKCECGQHN